MINTTNLKIEMAELKADVKHIKENLDAHITKEEEHLQKINDTIEKWFSAADKRYSGKWIEKIIVRAGWIVASIVIPAILFTAWAMFEHISIVE